jgi:tetratricopeptide (TPR) repeat protein
MLGLALLWAGSPEAGIASLQRGVELAKVPIDWMEANIGLGYLMLKRYDEAIEYLEGAARKAPKWGYCCLLLAFAYAESGDIAKAQNQWKKVLSLDPAISLRRPRPMMNWANDQEFSRRMVAALRSAGLK